MGPFTPTYHHSHAPSDAFMLADHNAASAAADSSNKAVCTPVMLLEGLCFPDGCVDVFAFWRGIAQTWQRASTTTG